MSDTRKELMARLITLQYDITHQDIVTFSAFLDDVELAKHVARYEERAAKKAGC